MKTKMQSKSKKSRIGQILLHIFFICLCACYILPFILILSVSFTDEQTLLQHGFRLLPLKTSLEAYQLILSDASQLIRSYLVTFTYSSVGTALAILIQAMMAYALSRSKFALNKPLTFLVFFTMLFSGGMVPSYIINTKYLHLNDTIWIYILPCMVSPWGLIVLRTNFKQLPEALFESAKIDGAGEWRICFQIAMPLVVPALAALAFISFVDRWNEWFTASLYIRDHDLYSLQYLLQKLLQETEFLKQQISSGMAGYSGMIGKLPTESYKFAMAVVAAGPVLLIFPFFQKYFSKGLTIGAVKG